MPTLTRWEPFTRWNPWKELEAIEKRLTTVLGPSGNGGDTDKKEAIAVA